MEQPNSPGLPTPMPPQQMDLLYVPGALHQFLLNSHAQTSCSDVDLKEEIMGLFQAQAMRG